MTAPPEGWAPHQLWHDLHLDIAAHREALALAALFFLMLVIGRALLPRADRARLRIALSALIFFFLAVPIRAVLLNFGLETAYSGMRLAGTIALAWGIVGVGGLIVFDLVGRRFGIPKIFRDVIVSVVSLVALVLVLSRSGVNFLSLITTSAVVTAVIGLALQDTIGNLFSGIAMQIEAPFWRSTIIQTKNDDLVVIPNAILTKGVVTIFGKDGLENRRWVYFNVHLRHPPNVVQKVVTEALAGTPNVSIKKPADCIVWKYQESWLEYAVRYRLVDYLPDDPTDSEVRKRIWYALHRNNIEIPYPGHNLFLTQLDEQRARGKTEMEMKRRLEAIQRVSFFAPLDATERELAAHGLVHRVYGNATVKVSVDGLEKEVAKLRSGDFFGEMSLMTGAPRSATVVAQSDVDCYVLNKSIFQQLLDKNPSLLGQVTKLFSEREVNSKMTRDGLSAEAARQHVEKQDLGGRIKAFFGIN
jgi:small-conductance mechanosensitive channel